MDDFYLSIQARAADWESTPAGHMDLARFRAEVLEPVRAGETAVYRPYSCREQRFGEERVLPLKQLNIVEGSYSHHPALGEYDEKIFLTCSVEEQRRRLQRREGGDHAAFAQRWIPLEERYFQTYDVLHTADLQVDTTSFFK